MLLTPCIILLEHRVSLLFHFAMPVVWIVSMADLDDNLYSWPVCVIWSWVGRPILPCHADFG